MTTVGAARAAAAVAASRAAAVMTSFVVAPPQEVADPERDAVDDHERVGGERERGHEVERFLDRRPRRGTLGAVRVDASVEVGVALDPGAGGDIDDTAVMRSRQLEGEGALAAARPSDQERQHGTARQHQ